MNKAILVLNKMPTECMGCPLFERGTICAPLNRDVGSPDKLYPPKPDWCPLKPMPDRKYFDVNMIFSSDDYMTEEIVENLEAYAWNACLNEIEGGGVDE